MSEKADVREYIIAPYSFETKEEYEQALQEKKAAAYLDSQLNTDNAEKTYRLYTELIDKKIFATVVGTDYLKKLRNILIQSGKYAGTDIPPVRITTVSKRVKNRVERYLSVKYETEAVSLRKENKAIKNRLSTSVIVNVVLIIVIAAMFFISKSGSSPTIINYERKLQDKYSAWESDLKEREQELKDLEWQLKKSESENDFTEKP